MVHPTPDLERRSLDYWHTSQPEELAAVLRRRSDMREWIVASEDRKNGKELTRFYHKPARYVGKIIGSCIVIEHSGVVRTDASVDPTRARDVLESLEHHEGQLALFGQEVAL